MCIRVMRREEEDVTFSFLTRSQSETFFLVAILPTSHNFHHKLLLGKMSPRSLDSSPRTIEKSLAASIGKTRRLENSCEFRSTFLILDSVSVDLSVSHPRDCIEASSARMRVFSQAGSRMPLSFAVQNHL